MLNLIVFPDVFKRFRTALSDYPIVLLRGKVQRADGMVHILEIDGYGLSFPSQELPSLSRDFH